MNEQVKQIAEKIQYSIYFSGIWQGVTDKFAEAIVQDCIERIGNLQGYSGYIDGKIVSTPDWNAAIKSAQELLTSAYLTKTKS